MRMLAAAILFAAAWLTWFGVFSPFTLTFGAASCALVILLARRSGFFDPEMYALHLIPRLPPFLFWLLKELVKANIDVARIVLSRRMPIEPTVITLDAQDLSPLGQTVVANSIGLTPGSVVTDINRGMIEVHCLTRAAADDLRSGELLRRVRRLSGS